MSDGTAEPRSLRLVATLFVAGLVCGLVLVGVYQITLAPIEKARGEALQKAVLEVLPGAVRMEARVWQGERLVPMEGIPKGVPTVYAGYDAEGKLLGYAIPGEGPGFQDTIRLIFGFDPSRKLVVGMWVLESRETPGLGDKIYKDAAFRKNFVALGVRPKIVLVKEPTGAPNEVDAITGATISSRAVVKIMNETFNQWDARLAGAGSAAPAESAGTVESRP